MHVQRVHQLSVVALSLAVSSGCGTTEVFVHDGGSAPRQSDGLSAPHRTPASGTTADDVALLGELPQTPPPVCSIELECGGPAIPDEPKIPCAIRVEDGRGAVQYDGSAGVEKRGRSSLAFPKPQYAVELRVSPTDETENPANLLGMGREEDWVLNGAYIDRALFRNKLLYDLFQSFGGVERYAPESAFCELTLDGTWQGIYLLTERVKRDDDRVALPKDDALDGSSFLLEQDDEGGIRDVGIAFGRWRLIYPHEKRSSARQVAGVVRWLDGWADVVRGVDKQTDLFSLVDLDSAVDFVLLQELAKNNDAYHLSLHVWRAPGGRLHFTPWDLDLSFGQPNYNDSDSPEGWILERPALVTVMAQQAAFQSRIKARWAELRAGVLSEDALLARIEHYVSTIAAHVERNFERWPIGEIQFLNDNLYPVSSYQQELELVRAWIARRLAWIDNNIGSYAVHEGLPERTPPVKPQITSAGTGCEDRYCLWIKVTNPGLAPCVDVRRVGGNEILDSYCGADIGLDAAREPQKITLRLRSRNGQHVALRNAGLRVWVVNRKAGLFSEPVHVKR
jgi:hypothetical protein